MKNSGRINEVKLTKIWRNQNKLSFPSIYLELFVISVLHGKNTNQLERNMLTILKSLVDDLKNKRIVDPANTNNILSDEVDTLTKSAISLQASLDRVKQYWSEIVS